MRYDLIMMLPSTPASALTLEGGLYKGERGRLFNGRMLAAHGETLTTTPMTDGLRDGLAITMSNGKLVSLVPWVNGLKEGEAKFFDPKTGVVLELIDYRRGVMDGMKLVFRPDGSLLRRELWVKGQQEGLTTTYFEDGTVETEVNYHLGEQAGSLKTYNAKGVLISDIMMAGQARHGLFTLYFEDTGLPAVRGTYDHDAYQGRITTWSTDGSYIVETYDKGHPVGPKEAYDPNGKRLETEFFDSKDTTPDGAQNASPVPETPAESMENAEHLEVNEVS